jgi:hypothetical protein
MTRAKLCILFLLVVASTSGALFVCHSKVVSNSRNRVPANAGGKVDVELDTGQGDWMVRSNPMMPALSTALKDHPKANRFRLLGVWGDCGVSGKVAVVYDRTAKTWEAWHEATRSDSRRILSTEQYVNVDESIIHAIAKKEDVAPETLRQHGCTLVKTSSSG